MLKQCKTEGCRNKTTLSSGVCTSCTVEQRFPGAKVYDPLRDSRNDHTSSTGKRCFRSRNHGMPDWTCEDRINDELKRMQYTVE